MAERKNNNKNNNENKSIKDTIFTKLSGYNKEGKGVKKRKITDKEKFSLKNFFIVYKEQFWNLIILNLIFLLMISPVFCGVFNYFGIFHNRVASPTNILFAPVYGMHLCYPTPVSANLVGIFGAQTINLVENNVTNILTYISLAVFLTFGFANVGMTYILRAYTKGEYAYLWHDFFKTIKKNFFSAIALGIADLILLILLVYSSVYYYNNAIDLSQTILFVVTFSVGVIYFIMRFYLYILLITFKLTPVKLIKNAFILALLGIKRNIMAIIGIIALSLIMVFVFMFWMQMGIVLPFFFLISNTSFMACFAAYPNIKKHMIDPYYKENPQNDDKLSIEEEPIFIDRG